jgi:pteridine reductase
MELRDRVALVTGAAQRVGREIALALAKHGAHVAVHHRSSRDAARETVREIRATGVRAATVAGDLAKPAVPGRLVERTVRTLGRLDILVNCASVFEATPWPPADEDWAKHLDVNLTGPMRLIRAATPELRQRGGAVVNIIDACWERPTWPDYSAYCVSKAALAALTQSLARELAPEVRVNGVAPGAVLPPPDYSRSDRRKAVARVPLERWGDPTHVAQSVVHVLQNDYITGEILKVDGGRAVV